MKRFVTLILAMVMAFTCFPAAVFAAEQKATLGMAEIGPDGYQVMTSSQKMLDMLKSMEGFYKEAYWDYAQWTIGYGSYAGSYDYNEKPSQVLTPAEAEELLKTQLREGYETKNGWQIGYEQIVNNFCRKIGKQPNQHQFDALVLFTYNLGGDWTNGSRLAAWLKNPTTEMEFVSAMGAWKRAGGEILYALVQRRIREAILFLKGEYSIPYKATADMNITSGIEVVSPSALPYYSSTIFELNGGKVDVAYSDGEKYNDFVMYYAKGSVYSPLPRPTREGYTFAGWKITRIGNNKTDIGGIVTIDTKVEKNVELTAQWIEGNVTVDGSDKFFGVNNTVTPNPEEEVNKPEVNIPAAAQPFEDVYTTSWFRDNVVYVYDNGYMIGTSDKTFAPDGQMTRGMLVTVLYRMDGSTEIKNVDHGFTDVQEDMYYADAIAWAKENGIVSGMSETTFAPGDPVTRQQAVTIFYRYCVDYKGADGSKQANLDPFPDAEEVGDWAETGMKWAVANSVITGTSNGSTVLLDVNGVLNRAQCAALIQRCCTQILDTSTE